MGSQVAHKTFEKREKKEGCKGRSFTNEKGIARCAMPFWELSYLPR